MTNEVDTTPKVLTDCEKICISKTTKKFQSMRCCYVTVILPNRSCGQNEREACASIKTKMISQEQGVLYCNNSPQL